MWASFPVLFKKPNRRENKYTVFVKLKLSSGNWLPHHPPPFEFFFVSRHCFPTLVPHALEALRKLRSCTCSSKNRPQGGSTSQLSARVTWATRTLEKSVLGCSFWWNVLEERAQGSCLPTIFPVAFPSPDIPSSALTVTLRVLWSIDRVTPEEGSGRWEPGYQEPWGAGGFSKLFPHRGPLFLGCTRVAWGVGGPAWTGHFGPSLSPTPSATPTVHPGEPGRPGLQGRD